MPQSDKSSAEQAKSRLRKVMSKSDDPMLDEQWDSQMEERMSVVARAKSRLRKVMGKFPSDDTDGTVAHSKAESKAKLKAKDAQKAQAERKAKAAAKQMAKLKTQALREAKAMAKQEAKTKAQAERAAQAEAKDAAKAEAAKAKDAAKAEAAKAKDAAKAEAAKAKAAAKAEAAKAKDAAKAEAAKAKDAAKAEEAKAKVAAKAEAAKAKVAAKAEATKAKAAAKAEAAKAKAAAKAAKTMSEPELVEFEIVDGDELRGESRRFAQKISDGASQIKDHISVGFTKKVKQLKRKKDVDPADLKDREANAIDADAQSADPVVPDDRALVVVYTPDELNEAQKQGAERILVKGELGKKLQTAFKGLRSLSSASFNALALAMSGAALFAPFTGGVSLGAAGTVMGTVGAALTATAIAAISAIGLALVIAVFKGYEEVRLVGGGLELVIKKGTGKDKDAQAEDVPDAAANATAT